MNALTPSSLRIIAIHLGVWCAVAATLVAFGAIGLGPGLRTLRETALLLVAVLMMVPPVYTALFLVDRLGRRWLQIVALSAASTAWALLLHQPLTAIGFKQTLGQDVLNTLIITGVAVAVRGGFRSLRFQRELREAMRMRDAAEQRTLGMQLGPHTLYNMLNTIYAATLTEPQRAPGLVLALADMMRHLTESARRDFCPAGDEWRFIEAYRDFAVEAGGEDVRIDLQFDGDGAEPAPSLLLVTLFENAVKHGRGGDGRLRVEARLRAEDGELRFTVENDLPLDAPAAQGLRLGQALVRQRLAFLYPSRHRFNAGASQGRYRVELRTW